MYTPSKIKISMLCALALCGQVRRDDLAIFARTADAGVRTIRELEDKGLIEDKTVDDIFLIQRLRIIGRSSDMHRTEYLFHLVDFDITRLLVFQAQRGNGQYGSDQYNHDRGVNDGICIALLVHRLDSLCLRGSF